jgi:hypothetical protein
MRWIVFLGVVLFGCATHAENLDVKTITLDVCLRENAPRQPLTWKEWLKLKTPFECCIDSCDVACFETDRECLATCQRMCWDKPYH